VKKSIISVMIVMAISAFFFLCGCLEEPQGSQEENMQEEKYQDEEYISWVLSRANVVVEYVNVSVDAAVNDEYYLAETYADHGYDYCLDTIDDMFTFNLSDDAQQFFEYSYRFFVDAKWFFFYLSLYANTQSVSDLHEANEYLEKANHDLENMTLWLKRWEAEKCP